ncbi:hypothetical protein GW17_00021831 [Ensete ventricosum]|nr:hypothetical protein GW17_00021831 [Ensete ventricosum]
MLVEAELGRLSGTEDDLTVEDYEARLTDVKQVAGTRTARYRAVPPKIDRRRSIEGEKGKKKRKKEKRSTYFPTPSSRHAVVARGSPAPARHRRSRVAGAFSPAQGDGTSPRVERKVEVTSPPSPRKEKGRGDECIALGVRKFNVNTEVRSAYLDALRKPHQDLVHLMASAKEAMKAVIAEKMHLFGSAGKA